MRLPFTIDLGRALFAVALSVLLYFVTLSETNLPETRDTALIIPVQVVNIPSGLVATTQPPPVRLRVTATPTVFNRLRSENFTATVDAVGAQAGDSTLPINVTSTDPEVQNVLPEPGSVVLHLEEIVPVVLPVRVNPQGQVASGYQLGTPTVDSPRVTVTGAASVVGPASEAVVDVNVDHLTVPVNGVYTPRIVDARGNDIKDPTLHMTPASVTVQIDVTQQTVYKQVGVRPVTQGEPAPGYALQPLEVNPPATTVAGDPNSLAAVNFVDTAPIDISGISTTVVRQVALAPPQRALLLQDNQTVTVTVRVSTLPVSQTMRVLPSVINLSGAVQQGRALDLVSVTITGPAPSLQNLSLNPNDFKVVVDATGKGPGRYTLDVKVQAVPSGLTLQDFTPKQVQVELTPAPSPTPVPSPTPTG
jgi:YbbR domain-containing protein